MFNGCTGNFAGQHISTISTAEIEEVSYDNWKVTFQDDIQTCFIDLGSTGKREFSLLEPLLISDKANLIEIYDENAACMGLPAFTLYFIEQLGVEKTTIEAIETGVDVATLFIPGAQGKTFFRILNYADKLSSVTNMAANYTELDDPTLSKYLSVTSGILGFADLSATSISQFKNLRTSAQGADALTLISRNSSTLNQSQAIKVRELINKINTGTDPDIVDLINNPLAKEVLIETLEAERAYMLQLGKVDLAEELSAGIVRLENLANGGGQWLDDLESLLGAGSKTKIQGWIDEGLDATKVEASFANATDKVQFYNKLDHAKSIQHQRVLINDLDNIPGVISGQYISNSVDDITQNVIKIVNEKQFTLKTYQAETFQKNANLINRSDIEIIEDLNNGIQFVKVKPGTKIYRVFDGYQLGVNTIPKGNYWTFEKPTSISEVIGGTAVQPEWNSMTKIIEVEVPAQGVYVWRGKAAKQPLSNNENISNYFLQGGTEQLIFDINQNSINITTITNSITNTSW